MKNKSKIDQRIENLFTGVEPEETSSKSESSEKVRQSSATQLAGEQKSGKTLNLQFTVKRKNIVTGIVLAVCLLAAIAFFTRPEPIAGDLLSGQPAATLATTSLPGSKPDVQPPDTPGKLSATANGSKEVDLTWKAAFDDISVAGYTIYRDGMLVATVSESARSYRDQTVLPGTGYIYALDAFDHAGNHSTISEQVQVETPALSANLAYFQTVADTYVNASHPEFNYHDASVLRLDSAPDMHAYLRFIVKGLAGRTITRARLMIYTNTSAAQGIHLVWVNDETWQELTINYNNAPGLGEKLVSSEAIPAESWISLDVSAYVTAEGGYDFGVITEGETTISLASRETGSNAPQLILDLQ